MGEPTTESRTAPESPVAEDGIGFQSNYGRGWKITFANGWSASVVYGPGSYSDNHDAEFEGYREKVWASGTAEVWSWDGNGDKHAPAEPKGWQSPDDVLAFLLKTAARKPAKVKSDG